MNRRRRLEYAVDTVQLATAALLLSAGVSLVATADHRWRLILGALLIGAGLFCDRYPIDLDRPADIHQGHVDTVALLVSGHTAVWRWRGACTCDWQGPVRPPTPDGMVRAEADVETHLEVPDRAPDASRDPWPELPPGDQVRTHPGR